VYENNPDLEHRLRRALHDAAQQQVRPDFIRAAELPARDVHSRQFRWSRLAGSIAAACAVLAVIVGATLAGRSPASRPGSAGATAAGAAHARPAVTAPALPSFVVVNRASSLTVFNSSTGAVTGTVTAPTGLQFEGVASGGTSQTFLAYANPAATSASCHAYYYRFKLAASGKPSKLTLIRSIPGSAATAIAASPGGGTSAYSAVHCKTAPPNGLIGISGQAGHRTWAYDEADDYTFSLAATANAETLALSLYVAGPGWANLLLNTHSSAATVGGASRVRPAIPYAQTLAVSPDGSTLYGCIPSGRTGELAAYSAATGNLIRVLHRWTLSRSGSYFCQVSADATGKLLLAAYSSDRTPRTSLIGINPQTGTAVTLPVRADYVFDGIGAAW
jgi:hypothetical protein